MNLTSWNSCARAYVSIAMAAGAGCSNKETRALLGVWGAADVQSQLDGVVRNKTIYEKIASLIYRLLLRRHCSLQRCLLALFKRCLLRSSKKRISNRNKVIVPKERPYLTSTQTCVRACGQKSNRGCVISNNHVNTRTRLLCTYNYWSWCGRDQSGLNLVTITLPSMRIESRL